MNTPSGRIGRLLLPFSLIFIGCACIVNSTIAKPEGWAYMDLYPWLYFAGPGKYYYAIDSGFRLVDTEDSTQQYSIGSPAQPQPPQVDAEKSGVYLTTSFRQGDQVTLLVTSSTGADFVIRQTNPLSASMKIHFASNSLTADVVIAVVDSSMYVPLNAQRVNISTQPQFEDYSLGITNHGTGDVNYAIVNSAFTADVSIHVTSSTFGADHIFYFDGRPPLYDRDFLAFVVWWFYIFER